MITKINFVFLLILMVLSIDDAVHAVEYNTDNHINGNDDQIPVVLLHGINNLPKTFDVLRDVINARSPNRKVFELRTNFDGIPGSWLSLHLQLNDVRQQIHATIQRNPQHFQTKEKYFDLICHSQGSLICRAYCETTSNHTVRTYISLAGPQMGVYGDGWIRFLPENLRHLSLDEIHSIAYQEWAQKSLSVANMWHDPYRESEFLNKNTFLPELLYPSGENKKIYRESFLRLRRAVFLVGNVGSVDGGKTTFDGGIDPWFSGIFSFYDASGNIVPLRKQDIYTKDTFGLKTLDKSKRLFLNGVPNVLHDDWLYNQTIISEYILPHLYNVDVKDIGRERSAQQQIRIA